jgi:hypothetical protein
MEGQVEGAGRVLDIAVTLGVPVLVWALVILGLIQLVREKARADRASAADGGGQSHDRTP